ncbi:hypothetical protein [Micromonospora profundi]|uniref:hypothetical protein n=1 Tax=Micromonospora profundi TaxID=1420889 RepID=UPI003656EF48
MNGGKKIFLGSTIAVLIVVSLSIGVVAWKSGGDEDPNPRLNVLDVPENTDSEALLAWAENVLAGRCMVHQEFTFSVAAPRDRAAAADPYEQLYGTDDVDRARQRGYGISPAFHQAERALPDPNRKYLETLSAQDRAKFDEAYFGPESAVMRVSAEAGDVTVGTEGCLAQARSQLYGGIAEWAPLDIWATGLDSQIYATVIVHPKYVASLGVWRGCMTAQSFAVSDPEGSRDRVAQLAGSADLREAEQFERKAAVADAGCNREANLRRLATELHKNQAEVVARQDATKLANYRDRRDQAVLIARDLVTELRK